eukprot:TRINITY_DN105728_c0_g1_i1.p1 TRINITY_DN105728_c0_g1~~TRINITY_DN105728_c0_g1_i1.p1  ORF type:complete len:348 (-),score=66.79 TRINITY_DN105728_c0_g1_i1:251-1267(-)
MGVGSSKKSSYVAPARPQPPKSRSQKKAPKGRWDDLHEAAEEGKLEVACQLLKRGADPNLGDKNSRTPLITACERGHTSVVDALLAAKGDPNLADREGNLPLSVAAERRHLEVVRALLSAKASPNVGNDSFMNLLLEISEKGQPEIVDTVPGVRFNMNHVGADAEAALQEKIRARAEQRNKKKQARGNAEAPGETQAKPEGLVEALDELRSHLDGHTVAPTEIPLDSIAETIEVEVEQESPYKICSFCNCIIPAGCEECAFCGTTVPRGSPVSSTTKKGVAESGAPRAFPGSPTDEKEARAETDVSGAEKQVHVSRKSSPKRQAATAVRVRARPSQDG